MSTPLPPQLSVLLQASDDVTRTRAWKTFTEEYSRLLLQVARRNSTNHDGSMDHYTYILERLSEDDYRRLRAFAGEGRGKFTTWLVVVARRLCVDRHRRTHGRARPEREPDRPRATDSIARRNLADLLADGIDAERVVDPTGLPPDDLVLRSERHEAVLAAVGKLDLSDRLLLKLRFEDDTPIGLLAPMVGLSSRWQVNRRLKSVLARLRVELESGGITEP